MPLARRSWPIARGVALAVALQVSLVGLAPKAAAETPVVLDPNGSSVAAYGGWAAWTRQDASTSRYELVLRSPRGAISLPRVAESGSPFDVELGPSGGSGVAAVYSRCANAASVSGCHIVELRLAVAGATERVLTPPGGGSNHEPAIWHGAVVFLRRNSSGGHRRPENLYAWNIGSRKLQSLALPASRGALEAGGQRWPAGLTGRITGVSFDGKEVAYVTANLVGTFGESTLWFEPLGGHPELIDQETSGAGNTCEGKFVSPVLSGSWLYAYLHACDPTANPHLDRLTRYRHGAVQSAGYTFIHSGDEAINSAVPDGPGVDWDAYGIERLAHVSWRTITPPVPQTFCNQSDPFC
jgi:hypothetical protein